MPPGTCPKFVASDNGDAGSSPDLVWYSGGVDGSLAEGSVSVVRSMFGADGVR